MKRDERRAVPPSGRRDRGTFSMFTVLFTPSVLLFAGLLLDGGMAIHARERALDIAEQSARKGADQIDVEHLRDTGEIILDGTACGEAVAFAGNFPGGYAAVCNETGPDEVTVNVTTQVEPVFLGLFIQTNFQIDVNASAHPEDGA
ncbi:putative Flp pilus-assembly TadE/G-like protein [Actinocorallia herbida]|uniref:Putative Flp pilus-assembly TadE/G-like protein n=1 Tax=Actinocorallia herbida TaxID=58109 RepID=A0A3N1D9C6_9ACTN|nr:Tad domain-containing protein [Actinocorallia herbida]ROO90096.1 putative Flp pilus-assembly TadE/G-like protein [Actinocorallia herbida]